MRTTTTTTKMKEKKKHQPHRITHELSGKHLTTCRRSFFVYVCVGLYVSRLAFVVLKSCGLGVAEQKAKCVPLRCGLITRACSQRGRTGGFLGAHPIACRSSYHFSYNHIHFMKNCALIQCIHMYAYNIYNIYYIAAYRKCMHKV